MELPPQIWKPAPLVVAQNSSLSGWAPSIAEFAVPIPDQRLRTRISVLIYSVGNQTNGVFAPYTQQGQIHLSSREADRDGRYGYGRLPLVNIVGTPSAGEVFPASTDLSGGSWTWDGAGDEIYGKLSNFPGEIGGGDRASRWQLQVTYAAMARLCPREWNDVVQKGIPYVIQPLKFLASGATSPS